MNSRNYIVIKNSVHTYDSHDGVISLASKDYGLEEIKVWSKIDYSLQYSIDGNSGSISSSVSGDSWAVPEQQMMELLEEHDCVFIAATSTGDTITEANLFSSLSIHVPKEGKLFNVTTGDFVDGGSTWYVLASMFYLDKSPFYYMVINNRLCTLTDFSNEDLADHPGAPYQYLEMDRSKRTFKEEIFGELIQFTGVKKQIGDNLILSAHTHTFSIDLANKSEALGTDTFAFDMDIESNMEYHVTGSKISFIVEKDTNYVSISIPNNIFKYSHSNEALVFNYIINRM